MSKSVSLAVCAALALGTVGTVGCGTILHPERRGQNGGRIDTGVAVMNGLWCLVFIIPGVVGFIIDFNNGTIYEPGGR